MRSFLNSKGVNVDPASLAQFATESVRRITFDNFKSSKLTQENIGVFQEFYHLGGIEETGQRFHLMKYSRPSGDKPVGIIANKIAYEGSDVHIKEIVKEYNTYVDMLVQNGKVTGKEEGFVRRGETYTLTNDNTFLTIQSVLFDAIHKSNGTARQELMDFMLSDLSKTKARDATLTFMSAYPEKTSKLVKLLINNGTIELKPGEGEHKGTYEYYVNKEQFAKKEIQDKILKFIEGYGINLETLETMTSNAQKHLETYLQDMYGIGDHKAGISQNRFFELYLPEQSTSPEKMNEFLLNSLYDINNNFRGFEAVNEILNKMNIKSGREGEAYSHLMQVLSNKLEGTTKKVFYFSDGEVKVKDTDLASYKTPYFEMLDRIGLKYALVDGMSHDWVLHPEYDKLMYQPLDIFQNKSQLISETDRAMIKQRRELFIDLLHKKTDIEGFEGGLTLIDMPGLKMSLAISKGDLEIIKTAFNDLYIRQTTDTFYPQIAAVEGSEARRKLDYYKERLDKSITVNDLIAPETLRLLIAESMLVGTNKNEFIKYLEMPAGSADLNKFFVSRQKLFNTMKFKRINEELMKAQHESRLSEQMNIEQFNANDHYLKKGKFGVMVFDDSVASFDLKVMFEAENGAGSWNKYYGDRKTESSHDSISFISKRMAEFLGLHYGAPGSKVFKPVISSQMENNLLYGKTEFVYDPKMDRFFSENQGVDILMSASAEKLKLYQG